MPPADELGVAPSGLRRIFGDPRTWGFRPRLLPAAPAGLKILSRPLEFATNQRFQFPDSLNELSVLPQNSMAGVQRRRGISLLEVLISMFVMLIGLLGVAAMIPAGRSEVLAGAKVDQAAMVGRAAFRDLKIRGYLNPATWKDASGTTIYPPPYPSTFVCSNANSSNAVTPAVAIDPLGLAAGFGTNFPFSAAPLSLSRINPSPQVSTAPLADPVFRSGDDLVFTASTRGRDFPPDQSMMGSPVAKRSSDGNYSWLATVVSDPTVSALVGKVTVSVAVFFKRDLSTVAGTPDTERSVAVNSIANGEAQLQYVVPAPPQVLKPVSPGQWIMLAGSLPVGAGTYSYGRWYRVVAADSVDTSGANPTQFVTLAGPDWTPIPANTTAWLFDNIVAVYEKNMRLELP